MGNVKKEDEDWSPMIAILMHSSIQLSVVTLVAGAPLCIVPGLA